MSIKRRMFVMISVVVMVLGCITAYADSSCDRYYNYPNSTVKGYAHAYIASAGWGKHTFKGSVSLIGNDKAAIAKVRYTIVIGSKSSNGYIGSSSDCTTGFMASVTQTGYYNYCKAQLNCSQNPIIASVAE